MSKDRLEKEMRLGRVKRESRQTRFSVQQTGLEAWQIHGVSSMSLSNFLRIE
jgi:hypothetical protein